MSLNEGFWMLYEQRWSDGYKLGDRVHAELLLSIELGKEIRRRLRRDRAIRAVDQRQLVEFGYLDIGGEG
jgi:hypothetical protein